MSKEVIYEISEEVVGEPMFKVTNSNDVNDIANLINVITEINKDKLVYFISKFGIEKILNNPSIMGITDAQEISLISLNQLLKQIGEIDNAI